MKKALPWIIFGVFAAWVLAGLRQPIEKAEFHSDDFASLPVLLNGRVQPLDSVARNALLMLRGKQSVALDAGGSLSAIDWLMEVTMRPEIGDTRKVFRIDHPDLRGLLKMHPDGPFYHAYTELAPYLGEIDRQYKQAAPIDSQVRTPYQKAAVKLYSSLSLYQRLQNSLRPEGSTNLVAEIAEFQKALPTGVAAVRAREAGQEFNKEDFERILRLLQPFDAVANMAYPLIIPPTQPEARRDAWENLGVSLMSTVHANTVAPPVTWYASMVTAYRQGVPAEFNRALAEYRQFLAERFQPEMRKASREFVYNYWRPFAKSTALYTLVFVVGLCSWFGWFQVLNRTAFRLLFLAFLVHSAGILFRMILEGRPPVTNLYSSAVFVGWGAVALGLILERFYRDGIGIVMASAVGVLTQIVAHNLSLGGDTMEMMRAVLDTNFWLATHVITITLGYSATFVAGFLGILYVVRGVFTRTLDPNTAKALTRMVYGIICFATLFSFIGTILGGIWADQSWGRFWGWDPKENGALIIVLWNAIILHARWGGMVRERGLMNLAIFGNVITSYSWFGVNMLGVGLHSYGFMDQAFVWLMLFTTSQLVFIGLGLLPPKYWASLRARTSSTDKPAAA